MAYAYQPLVVVVNSHHGRRAKFTWAVVAVAAIITLATLFHWRPREFPIISLADETYLQGCPDLAGKTTRYLGGTPGFTVLENVWYNDHTFHFVRGENATYPDEKTIMTGTKLDVATQLPVTPSACFHGTSIFLNAGANKDWNILSHYYHFAVENIVGGFAALATTQEQNGPVTPDRVIVPWKDDWRDKWAMNDAVMVAVFGRNVVERRQWRRLEAEGWIYFEKVVLVDRWAAHTSQLVQLWNKMPLEVFEKAKHVRDFFATAQNRMNAYFHVEPTKPSVRHHIAYIDRQATHRRLHDEDHQAFLDEMHALAADRDDVEFEQLVLEKMSPAEQFQALAHANVLVGVHGNGLTHVLWIKPNSTVIEMFPPGGFLRDYQCATEVLGHNYTAIRGDEIITKEKWEADPGPKHQAAFGGGWFGTPRVEVNVPLLVDQVHKAVARD